ncbi:transmembrane and coiled-coil domain-containing protein 3-like isoform X1 [Acanthaster planci]|uniref:Transmembrane and coiled-coil domain-containing protein 3-like isoform X1 n=1 Tax=Acanthaster planci TaxID=133434 RepID=A0A8B7YJN7_ACAPL|nr:transmembrane and coiled-coil domain-containing protein 3-like isoform X1 [Acanthaster planci]XP_022093460.1 transmembrane and coiled-coil domain-containing protein 3-like isoform X1 [Acanthaster planci]
MAGRKLLFLLSACALLACCPASGKNPKRPPSADRSQEVAKQVIKIHRGKEPGVSVGGRTNLGATGNQTSKEAAALLMMRTLDGWLGNSCQALSALKQTKELVIRKLDRTIAEVQRDKTVERAEKLFRIHMFEIFQRELNESEDAILMSINGLKRALEGNYKDVLNMKESSRQRLQALREATLREELEYNDILAAEKHQKAYQEHLRHYSNASLARRSKVEAILDEILSDVAEAADNLENRIGEHVFDQSKQAKGAHVEAVVRLDDEDIVKVRRANGAHQVSRQQGMSHLIDASDNQYVLAKPKDTTVPLEDHHLLQDILLLSILAFLCGWMCLSLGLPTMFGYTMAGVILGSSGLNLIKALVQFETLGEFGAFFILFTVGLEFSPEKIKKVWRIAVFGSIAMTVIMIVFGVVFGYIVNIIPGESAFIAACLSLSSTPLVVKFLGVGHPKDDKDIATDTSEFEYSSTLLGILVMQDVQLGLLVAILPALAGVETASAAGLSPKVGDQDTASLVVDFFSMVFLLTRVLLAVGAVVLLSFAVTHYVMPFAMQKLRSSGSKEIMIMGSVALAFNMLMITDLLGVSMELGCFLAGVILSSMGHATAEEIRGLVEPIRDFFAALFFGAIGLHVFPSFVFYELTFLTSLTLIVVAMKFFTAIFVLGIFLPLSNRHIKWIVASGLAQVSEFSFVLGSRARRLGLLSREVYLLVLSVTTLSLLLAPVLWRVSLWRCRRIQHRPTVVR